MLFGDEATVRPWSHNRGVQLHGPGLSKVILGADRAASWRDSLDLIEASITDNGGRSCLNASGVWLPAHGRELAEALAERLARIEALPLDDPRARIAAFSDPATARRIDALIERRLHVPGAEDLTARARGGGRLVERGGCTFLLPTVIWCRDPEHPLASTELLFPFASVVEVAQPELLDRIGPTLVATAITDDAEFKSRLLRARDIDRLNLGAIPTSRVSWNQPHEGNLFEHLHRRRAFQAA
jgi:acyl-CoA reductase-like NAD-dependent aldehyde dehydrogenase